METGRLPLHVRNKTPEPTKGRRRDRERDETTPQPEERKTVTTERPGFFRGARVTSKR